MNVIEEKDMKIIDRERALRELNALSPNAKMFLMDLIGNNLTAIRLSNQLGRRGPIDKCIDTLVLEMQHFGLFEGRIVGKQNG